MRRRPQGRGIECFFLLPPLGQGRDGGPRLRGVTAAQVQAVAQKYFGDDQMTVATLLPQPRDPNAKARTAPAAGARH